MPFIIHNENKTEYVVALREAQTGGDCSKLARYFEREQENYAVQCELYDIYSRYDYFLKSQNAENKSAQTVKKNPPHRHR